MLVKAKRGLQVPFELFPQKCIDGGLTEGEDKRQQVEVANTAYYQNALICGDLELAEEKSAAQDSQEAPPAPKRGVK